MVVVAFLFLIVSHQPRYMTHTAPIFYYIWVNAVNPLEKKKIYINQLNEMRCSATNNGNNFKYLTLLPYCFWLMFFVVALNLSKKRAELYCFCVNAKCNTDNSAHLSDNVQHCFFFCLLWVQIHYIVCEIVKIRNSSKSWFC